MSKAQLNITFENIIQFSVSALVFLLLLKVYTDITDPSFVEKKVLAADSALLLDSISFLPGDFFIEYSNPLNYTFDFKDNYVQISKDKDSSKTSFSFNHDTSIAIETIKITKEKFTILKSGNIIEFDKKPNFNKLSCPLLDKKFDSITFSPKTVDDVPFVFVNSIKEIITVKKYVPKVYIKNILQEKTDVHIIIKSSDKKNFVKAEFPLDSESSRTLACHILNKFASENIKPILIPSNIGSLSDNHFILEISKDLQTPDSANKISEVFKNE